jgi:precorrin-8X/cobalt-precorrin-8 methylmutase
MTDYLRDGRLIYEQSFAIIRAEADLSRFTEMESEVAVRMIHACGMVESARHFVFCITRARLPAGNPVLCSLGDPAVAALAGRIGTTRSAAALELWRDYIEGAIVAIGNAPTALFRLLEMLKEGAPRPAAIVGMPVGFVGAAESKEALIADPRDVPFVTVRGRIGGSAMTAAAVNALARTGQ